MTTQQEETTCTPPSEDTNLKSDATSASDTLETSNEQYLSADSSPTTDRDESTIIDVGSNVAAHGSTDADPGLRSSQRRRARQAQLPSVPSTLSRSIILKKHPAKPRNAKSESDSESNKTKHDPFCVCGVYIEDAISIQCDLCHNHWHLKCASLEGLTSFMIETIKTWHCYDCFVSPVPTSPSAIYNQEHYKE